MGRNRNLFRQPGSQNASRQLLFGGRRVNKIFEEYQQPAIQTKKVQLLGGFFY
jgi:hypothetical protein